jgi:3-(3-hydroxy-phenyl)propionate hydroxylase
MKPNIPDSVDVLLVGMGPVGAAAASLLGRQGISTLVIDKALDVFTAPRAIVLDNEALRILQWAGLEDGSFETIATPTLQMHSPVFGNYARANTAGAIDCHPWVVTFYQPELERVLRSRLPAYPCVHVSLGTELTGFEQDADGVHATLRLGDGSAASVHARFLIGADGASSFVRHHTGLGFEGKTFTQDWLVIDVIDAPRPIDHIEFTCDPRRPSPHMPAPGNRQRWEFMLQPGETREEMEKPEKIRELLAPWCKPEDLTIERTAVYRFHARIVDRFSKGRVFLVGDAAHITPPFVGQGLVSGLRDVANLSWKLASVLRGQADQSILDSYDTERRPHARSVIDFALQMGRLIMPRNRLTAFGVHGLMTLAQLIPSVRAFFEELKMKPPSRFRQGLFTKGRTRSKLVRGGTLPQGLVRSGPGAPAVPSDDVLGPRLALVGFGCYPVAQLSAGLLAEWTRAGGCTVQIRHRGQPAKGEISWEDMTNALVPGAAPVGWVAVVRPDRTIMHDGPLGDVGKIVSETLALLQGGHPRCASVQQESTAGLMGA